MGYQTLAGEDGEYFEAYIPDEWEDEEIEEYQEDQGMMPENDYEL